VRIFEDTLSISGYVTLYANLILAPISIPIINANAKWVQNGITVAGGNGQGSEANQLYSPWGVYVDEDQTIYVADTSNHRIVEWKRGATSGQVVAGGKGAGNRNDQLNYPINVVVDKETDSLIICDYNNQRVVRWPRRKGAIGETIISNIVCCDVTMDNNEHLYISDYQQHEVRRWKIGETHGTLVAGGNGAGNRLNQLNQPYHIFIDQDHSVYVSDYGNHRIMKWMKGEKEGIIVAGGQNSGDRLTQLSGPRGIIVDQQGTLYVADQNNHRVTRWLKGATESTIVVGGNKPGGQANQFNSPLTLSFDRQNNLYVTDYINHRVQKFKIE
jgi:sugar lactone lactonase YvrE